MKNSNYIYRILWTTLLSSIAIIYLTEFSSYEIYNQHLKSIVYYSLPIIALCLLTYSIFAKTHKANKFLSILISILVFSFILIVSPLRYINATSVWETRTILLEHKNDKSKRVEFQVQDVGALGFNKRTVEVKHIMSWIMKVKPYSTKSVNKENWNEAKNEFDSMKSNHYQSPSDCFKNVTNVKIDSTKFDYQNGKLFRKRNSGIVSILTCDLEGEMYFRDIQTDIDIYTAQENGEFWVDVNHVYGNYETSDGEMPYKIESADVQSFQNLKNSVYGIDKDYVYSTRHGKIESADSKTFKPIFIDEGSATTAYGKDKMNYFFWDEIIEDTIEFKEHIKNE